MVSVEALRKFVSRIAFILLLAAAGTLLVHPGDLVPGFEDLPIYQVLVTSCLLASLPLIVAQLRMENGSSGRMRSPASCCSWSWRRPYPMWCAATFTTPRMAAEAVAKVALLYLLVVGLGEFACAVRVTLAMVAVFVLGMTVLAVLQYHNVIHLPWHWDVLNTGAFYLGL